MPPVIAARSGTLTPAGIARVLVTSRPYITAYVRDIKPTATYRRRYQLVERRIGVMRVVKAHPFIAYD
jgi:hypothetical protein